MKKMTVEEIWSAAQIDERSKDHNCTSVGSNYATNGGCEVCWSRYFEYLDQHPEIVVSTKK